MSRGIKDLRELICVSRLTVLDSDEEFPPSDDEILQGRLSRLEFGIDTQSLSDGVESRNSSAGSANSQTPDSGIATNGTSREDFDPVTPQFETFTPCPPSDGAPKSKNKRKRKKKKKQGSELMGPLLELPKSVPLPPVRSDSMVSSGSSEGVDTQAEHFSNCKDANTPSGEGEMDGNFDSLLTYLNATQVAEWLVIANQNVTDIATWCHSGENFVHFGHFWLSDFPDMQKQDIFQLEYSILLDHLQFAFASGRNSGKVKQRDLTQFLEAVFREYPSRLLSSKGAHLFLDYLDVLSSERTDLYKKVLSNVKCSTKVKQNAQWTLAIRSFTLVSVWMAVINFYRQLTKHSSQSQSSPTVSITAIGKADPSHTRVYQAIRNGYIDMVNYLLRSGKVHPQSRDGHGRTLVFTAVMHNQPKVLQFLLSKHVRPRPDVNLPSETGNTPLHAAANNGNADLVQILLQVPWLKVDAMNAQCENATPLHLAAMHGFTGVVELLLAAKANPRLKMGELDIYTIAKDFGHDEILTLLEKYT